MKKAILPALIAAMFAVSVNASARELLFGPEVTPQKPRKAVIKKELALEPSQAVIVTTKKSPVVRQVAPVAVMQVRPVEVVKAPKEVVKPAEVVKAPKEISKPVVASVPVLPKTSSVHTPVLSAPEVLPVLTAVISNASTKSAAVYKGDGKNALNIVAPGGDPLSERARLSAKFKDSVSIGFAPAEVGNQDDYSFLMNYLPLSNFLSEYVGSLVSFSPERNKNDYRQNIAEAFYPVIFIDAMLAREAAAAGYVPVITNVGGSQAGFVTLASSKYKSMDGLDGAKIAVPKQTQLGVMARADLLARSNAKSLSFLEIGASSESAKGQLDGGYADVVALPVETAEKYAASSGGKFRMIGSTAALPSTMMWVRKDFASNSAVVSLMNAMLEVKLDAQGAAKQAAAGLAAGFGGKVEFVAADGNLMESLKKPLEIFEAQSGPVFDQKVVVNEAKKTANLGRAMRTERSALAVDLGVTQRMAMAAKMSEGLSVGFIVPSSKNQDVYTFQRDFTPLSDYLSDQSGVLVSLVPERVVDAFGHRIYRNEYSAIVIGPSLARVALLSGYTPVARGGDFVSPAFLVPVNSGIKELGDLKDRNIATVRASDAAIVGRWELLKRQIGGSKFSYFNSSSDAARVLQSGATEAVLLRTTEAAEMALLKDAKGAQLFRVVNGTEEVPAVSMWVRHDAYDHSVTKAVGSAFSDLGDDGSALKRKAFAGYLRGFGVKDSWQSSGIEEHIASVEMTAGLISSGQAIDKDLQTTAGVLVQENAREKGVTKTLVKYSAAINVSPNKKR